MAEIIKFPGGSPDKSREPKSDVIHMRPGVWYDLESPINIGGKIFSRVQCEYQVPSNPNEYVVRGMPQNADKIESFVLRFGKDRGVKVSESKDQDAAD